MDSSNFTIYSNIPHKEEFGEFKNNPTRKIILRQIFAVSAALADAITSGVVSGFSAIILEQLEKSPQQIHVTKEQGSWIASVAVLPMILSCLLSGVGIDKLGRRKTFLIASGISCIGWMTLYFAQTLETIIIGRIISGFSVGLMCPAITAYLGEIGHPKYRSIILSSSYIGISLGVLIVHAMGALTTWRTISLWTAGLNFINILAFLYLPDSHVWHIRQDAISEGRRVFFWYRGNNDNAKTELAEILEAKSKKAEGITASDYTILEYLKFCATKAFLKPLFVIIVFVVTMHFSGNKAIIFYSISILREIAPNFNQHLATLIIDLTRLAFGLLGCVIFKRYRIRMITMFTCSGAIVSLCGVALFRSAFVNADNKVCQVISLVFLMGYIVCLACGLAALPLVVCGEVFPAMMRGLGSGICTFIYFLSFAVLIKYTPTLVDSLGISGTFLSFAVCTFIGSVILYFVLPETKNKTLQEIENMFK